MDYASEIQTKLARVRQLMEQHGVGALWLRRVDNVAWITGGVDVAVNTADAFGVASVVVGPDSATMWTTTIEAPRLVAEDHVEDRGFEMRVSPWEQAQSVQFDMLFGVDAPYDGATDLSAELRLLRSRLLPVEVDRFRALGRLCADAMQHSIARVEPGLTEHELAGILSQEVRSRGATPIVVLIATDERIHRVRHPLPLDKKLDKYVMLVLCGRKEGLVCSVTRLVHFGALPDDLRRRMDACAEVDAAMTAASQPGTTLEDVFRVAQDTYAQVGFEGEWKLHHQGGLAGYSARESIATPGDLITLEEGMICAWNPSITGTKSEDTILVTPAGVPPEILTAMQGWPTRRVEVGGMTLQRPLIMERA